ncbi:MAG: pantoate--beta-alanine ligase [Actinobacteria bacterium]|nr:pantoate--beta-alanine ligase [Acidimicrobiia bacterium]PHX60248.1 MAG: pantoate--beta-alanine ligase [Actinomycetota bacterium]
MKVVTTISDVRAITGLAHKAGETVGFVPTMGALHDGHRSLMKAARSECGSVGVSVFVNPTQFGPGEDFDTYPRALAADEAICKAENVDWLFAPPVSEMFPDSARTTVHVSGLTEVLCGLTRPGHFDGVTTVVAKLFLICGSGRAYFGRKDAQQLAVVRQMVKDLNLPIAVIDCPTVREKDGLAMSSRNAGLSANERQAATVIPRALRQVLDQIVAGERSPRAVAKMLTEMLASEPIAQVEYVEVVDADTLTSLICEPVSPLTGNVLLAVAVRFGSVRLIDNASVVIENNGPEVVY